MVVHGVTGVLAAVFAVLLWVAIPYAFSMALWWWAAPEGSVSAFVVLDTWPEALTMPFVYGTFNVFLLVWLVPRLARWQAVLAAALLGPTSRTSLADRVEELTTTRAEALEAHGAELRRIERDLHDGTQAQLVITERSVSKHIGSVFSKLGLPPSDSGHRRVLAVLTYLNASG